MLIIENNKNKRRFNYINEKYKILRTNILHLEGMQNAKVVLITDVDGKVNKEKIIVNLAISFSKLKDMKVLIVDADFKKSSMHDYFNANNTFGLYNTICDINGFENNTQKITQDKLYFKATGPIPTNSSELLSQKGMIEAVDFMRKNYDFTIINSATLDDISDSQILSTIVDGNILAIKVGKTKIKKIKAANTMLNRVNAKVMGVIAVD